MLSDTILAVLLTWLNLADDLLPVSSLAAARWDGAASVAAHLADLESSGVDESVLERFHYRAWQQHATDYLFVLYLCWAVGGTLAEYLKAPHAEPEPAPPPRSEPPGDCCCAQRCSSGC